MKVSWDVNYLNKIFINELQNLRSKIEFAYESASHDEDCEDVKVCMDGLELSYLISALSMYIHAVSRTDKK